MQLKWDGVTDDAPVLQQIVNSAVEHRPVKLPPGVGLLNSPVTITGNARIVGHGRNLTTIQLGTTGQTGFIINSQAAVEIEGMAFWGDATQTAISVSGANGGFNANSLFRDLLFKNFNIGIDFQNAANWVLNRSLFVCNTGAVGIQVANGITPDAGDSTVSDITYFATGNPNGIGILQKSSGGLKVANSKFVGGAWGYLLHLDPNVQTGDLLIGNCSIESQSRAGIGFIANTPLGSFNSVVIHGCQFSRDVAAAKSIWKIDSTAWLDLVNVKGCTGTVGRIALPGVVNLDLTGNI